MSEFAVNVLSLNSLIESSNRNGSTHLVERWLASFSCVYDKDIEQYLHTRAIKFESLGKSRTYLVYGDESVGTYYQPVIYGFFTIALKVLDFPKHLSNRKRLELDGFSAKLRGDVIQSVPCYLIGQLAKNSARRNAVSGTVLIETAVAIAKTAAKYVGGRYALVECRDNPHLCDFYTRNGFEEFDTISDGCTPMVQMLRRIY